MKFRAIKGVRDILPPESALWNRVEQIAREVFAAYGYQEIRLPIFEETELFARSVGLDTDIVSKEMYFTFEDRPEIPTVNLRDFSSIGLYLERAKDAIESGQFRVVDRTPFDEFEGATKNLAEARNRSDLQAQYQAIAEAVLALQKIQWGAHLVLRPEATAWVVRAYIEHGMRTWPGDVKLYYIGPMFRRERPQKGRYRQFYQIGVEVLGQSDHPAIDAEVIEMLLVFLDRCGLAGYTTYINSIGCRECRPKYVARLREALVEHINELKGDSQRRVETNPLRVLDSKLPEEQPIIEKLPSILDHLCDACRGHFERFKEQLKLRGIAYEINWRLVRGLDYYMRTTFEVTAPGLGAQNAICGGGRYDGLVELLGGPAAKGMGFALGTDRFILALQQAGKGEAARAVDVFVAWMGEPAYGVALKLARRLRAEGFAVELPAEEMKLKKSLSVADKLGARYALIVGENEVAAGRYTLKRLADAHQESLPEEELVAHMKEKGRSG